MRLCWLLSIVACGSPEVTKETVTSTPAGTAPALCGDAVLQEGEACDDGNAIGGDGCLPDCAEEAGPGESEPNDSPDAAQAFPGEPVHGGLPAGDVDCWSFDVAECASVSAALVGDCPQDAILALRDPAGIAVASGSLGVDGCPILDPVEAPGAQFVAGGAWTLCVSSLTGSGIAAYTLDISQAVQTGFPLGAADDPDADGLPDRCDDDRDGDGAPDATDNCPDAPNGPDSEPFVPSAAGFLRDWLVLAPIVAGPTVDCLPSADELTGGDAFLAPHLGDTDAGLTWVAWLAGGDILDFLPLWGFVDAPREVYVQTWVFTAATRDVTLAVGADDGVRAWLNGSVLLDISSCQGTNPDQFQAPATLVAGWNPLTLKVRDNGGGWGLAVRFLDSGAPVTDLELSLTPDGPWLDDQSDRDRDGIGDVCDPAPAG